MSRSQQIALILIVAAAILIYATLGAGVLVHGNGGSRVDPDDPQLPAWTEWLDRLTGPFQPRVSFSRNSYDFSTGGSIPVPPAREEVRRAVLRVTPPRGARLTYDCACGDQEAPAVWPREGTPRNASTVSFAVYGDGGTIRVEPLVDGSVRITPE